MNPKRKSQKRFEQANDLVDRIGPTLPSPTHLAVLFIAWRHATNGRFRVSARQFSTAMSGSLRNVRRVLDELETAGVISIQSESQGTIPRTYKFTGKTFSRGDTMAPLGKTLGVTNTTPRGDKYDT